MRILMLAQFYAPVLGGEERVVQDLSRELVRRGHTVAVATQGQAGQPAFELDEGVRVYRLHSTTQRLKGLYADARRQHAPPLPDPELVRGLRQVVSRERPQVVHAHNWLVHSYLPLKTWSRAPLVMSLHDYSLVCATKRLMYNGLPCSGPQFTKCMACSMNHYGAAKGTVTTLSNWIMSVWERGAVDQFLPISEAVAVGNGLVGTKLPYRIIPNFIPDDWAKPANTTDPRLAQLPEKGYLLFAGDMSDDKGVDVLLRAYRGMTNAPPLVMIVKRAEPRQPELLHNVIVTENWPHDLVMEAWRRCGIALVPSVWAEPFGLVAIEAMLAGRPVIASRTGGLAGIVADGETGLLVDPGNSDALRHAIEHLLGDPELRERMGQAAKVRAENYRADKIVPRVEQVYQSLCHAGKVVNSGYRE